MKKSAYVITKTFKLSAMDKQSWYEDRFSCYTTYHHALSAWNKLCADLKEELRQPEGEEWVQWADVALNEMVFERDYALDTQTDAWQAYLTADFDEFNELDEETF
jgi:hypothetical protein